MPTPAPIPAASPSATRRTLLSLIVVNAVLLAGLALLTWMPEPAIAQPGRGGSYIMLSGEAIGLTQEQSIYLIDTRRFGVSAVSFNGANREMKIIAQRALTNDFTNPRAGGKTER